MAQAIMRRRGGGGNLTFADLVANMTLLDSGGFSTSTTGTANVYLSRLSLEGRTLYVFSVYNGGISWAKIEDGEFSVGAVLKKTVSSQYPYATFGHTSSAVCVRPSATWPNVVTSSVSLYYGGTIFLVEFPALSNKIVEDCLSRLVFTSSAGRAYSGTAATSLSAVDQNYVLTCYRGYVGIGKYDASTGVVANLFGNYSDYPNLCLVYAGALRISLDGTNFNSANAQSIFQFVDG